MEIYEFESQLCQSPAVLRMQVTHPLWPHILIYKPEIINSPLPAGCEG